MCSRKQSNGIAKEIGRLFRRIPSRLVGAEVDTELSWRRRWPMSGDDPASFSRVW
jgi:hypothetical protein